MLIVMRHGAAEDEIQRVVATIEEMGYQARPMPGKQRTTVGLVGNDGRVDGSRLAALPGVQEIIHVTQPYKQVSREWQPESTGSWTSAAVNFWCSRRRASFSRGRTPMAGSSWPR